jgi:2-aminobenzoate-CoA ligase
VVERAYVEIALCDARLVDDLTATGAACLRNVCVFGDGSADSLERRAAAKQAPFNAVETAADDVVLIAFTSGTTGVPKGTMHFHRDVLAVCDTFSRHVLKPAPDDLFVSSPPIAFTFGLGGSVLFPLRAGAASLLLESTPADALVDAIDTFGATVVFTAPTAYRQILQRGSAARLRSLRRCVSAGETLPRAVYDAWLDSTGLQIIDGIGATEMLHIFVSASDGDIRPGATGRPVPGYEARVVDDEMRDVAPGVAGRLAVRGPTGCRYLDDERQRDYVVDGWNVTGDTYVRDEDGYFWYQARNDDMIVTSGFNVAAPEVEEVLLEHDAVEECAVVGVPDDVRGSIVKAFVVARPGATVGDALAAELQAHVKQALAPYKYPRAIEFVAALPRTATGKLQRHVLRSGAD